MLLYSRPALVTYRPQNGDDDKLQMPRKPVIYSRHHIQSCLCWVWTFALVCGAVVGWGRIKPFDAKVGSQVRVCPTARPTKGVLGCKAFCDVFEGTAGTPEHQRHVCTRQKRSLS